MKEKKKILILTGIFLVLAIAVFIFYYQKPKVKLPSAKPTPPAGEGLSPTIAELPTIPPEKMKALGEIETLEINIANRAFSPPNLTIKRYDQVQWNNNDDEVYQLKTEDWESPLIEPGLNFTQAFDQPGTFPYYCILHPNIKGTIIVTE